MSRFIPMAILLGLFMVASCNRFPDLSIQVTGNIKPDTSCQVADDSSLYVVQGVYDIAAPAFSYVISPQIISYIYDNASSIEASAGNMQIQGFDITIKLPDGTVPDFGESLPNPYFVTSNAFLPSNQTIGAFSQAAAIAAGIPATYRSAVIAAAVESGFGSIVLGIRATGQTVGGFTQRSPTFDFPVNFCDGCLAIDVCASEDEEGCYPGQDSWKWCETIEEPTTTP